VQYVSGMCDTFLVADDEAHTSLLNQGDLFVRVVMRRSNYAGGKTKATHHHLISNNHLPLYTIFQFLHGHRRPVGVLRLQIDR
jgi:hypothetical protein